MNGVYAYGDARQYTLNSSPIRLKVGGGIDVLGRIRDQAVAFSYPQTLFRVYTCESDPIPFEKAVQRTLKREKTWVREPGMGTEWFDVSLNHLDSAANIPGLTRTLKWTHIKDENHSWPKYVKLAAHYLNQCMFPNHWNPFPTPAQSRELFPVLNEFFPVEITSIVLKKGEERAISSLRCRLRNMHDPKLTTEHPDNWKDREEQEAALIMTGWTYYPVSALI